MYYSIDYYSFTILLDKPLGEGMFESDYRFAIDRFCDLNAAIRNVPTFREGWAIQNAKGFYSYRLRHETTDATISYGSINAHLLVELAGKACNTFDAADLLMPLIQSTCERATRIDFAVDILCNTSPFEFIGKRGNVSFKSSGNKYSPTGGTEYLGGRSSDRMVRVYRYYEPHPRADFLRVEAEYKGSAAKASAAHLITAGVWQASLDAHHPFQWQHDVWQPDISTAKPIKYSNYRPSNASTVHWIYGDVVTALRKAAATGLIDLDEWLKYLREVPKDEI